MGRDSSVPSPRQAPASELIFYDGGCGLCHRFVRFVLGRAGSAGAFRFAPLQGETYLSTISGPIRAGLPDTIVLRTADGRILVRSAAVLHVLSRLGGFWRLVGRLARLVPRGLSDACYDAVAAVRHRLFARPAESCPVVPEHLRGLFDP
jgi:predicted DCC family thiol-disulfide oxidoreductase YuxK